MPHALLVIHRERLCSGVIGTTARDRRNCAPGEFGTDKFQSSGVDIGLRREWSVSAPPKFPQIRFARGLYFGASVVRTLLRPVRLLDALYGSDRFPSQRRLAESARGVSPRAAHRFRT